MTYIQREVQFVDIFRPHYFATQSLKTYGWDRSLRDAVNACMDKTYLVDWPKFQEIYLDPKFKPEKEKGYHATFGAMAMWAVWKYNPVIYVADIPTVQRLANKLDAETLPSELFLDMPYPTFLIQIPRSEFGTTLQYCREGDGLHTNLIGCWVQLRSDGILSLMLQTIFNDPERGDRVIENYIEMRPEVGKSIKESLLVAHIIDPAFEEVGCINALMTFLNIIQFITLEKPDIEYVDKPMRNRRRKGNRLLDELIAPPGPFRINVGARLRKVYENYERDIDGLGDGYKVRPYIRSGHMHLYWTGPKDNPEQPQVPKMQWVAPVLCAMPLAIDEKGC